MSEHSKPTIVIVGGGFGGMAAAKALRKAPAKIVLIDRSNHHLFQPLLYQVAISVLGPGQIASPIRGLLRRQANTTVVLADVIGVDKDEQRIIAVDGDGEERRVSYDHLILATGASHNYFGHEEFAKFAPGLKSLADAVAIRNKILKAFEIAEAEVDPSKHRDLLTFVLIGGGPTGVELAGAISIFIRGTLKSDFRRVDPAMARIVLIDGGKRVLGTFSEKLSAAAMKRLQELGVEVRLGHRVDEVDDDGVVVAGERVASKTVIWTAGVTPSPAGKWLGVETDRAGRVRVQPDLSVPGHPEIFVVGDTMTLEQDGHPLPGVAQVAMQQGRYVGKLLRRVLSGRQPKGSFRYFDKGNMAVVGKGFAVLQSGRVHMSGLIAWFVWGAIHLQYLAQRGLRISVGLQWIWLLVTGQVGSRLIVNHHGTNGCQPCIPDHRESSAGYTTERSAAAIAQ
jgi:NADH dehydrogenase FAD-containing subunit